MKLRYLKQAKRGDSGLPKFTYAKIKNEYGLESQVSANPFFWRL